MLPANDPGWLAAQGELQGYDGATRDRLAAVIAAIAVPARGILLRSADGRPVASALVDVADGIVIAGNVVTAAAERHKGYGSCRDAVRAGMGDRRGRRGRRDPGARRQPAALALYGSLGYAHLYDYHYRQPPG